MPNIKSAAKRNRQNLVQRQRNRIQKSSMKTSIRKFLQAIDEGNQENAQQQLQMVVSRIDKSGKKNIIHKRKADRLKSRLSVRYNRAFAK